MELGDCVQFGVDTLRGDVSSDLGAWMLGSTTLGTAISFCVGVLVEEGGRGSAC